MQEMQEKQGLFVRGCRGRGSEESGESEGPSVREPPGRVGEVGGRLCGAGPGESLSEANGGKTPATDFRGRFQKFHIAIGRGVVAEVAEAYKKPGKTGRGDICRSFRSFRPFVREINGELAEVSGRYRGRNGRTL